MVGILGLMVPNVYAVDWYVATNGSDFADGATWNTAKATIQDAVDAASSNDTIWVSNGVYDAGGRVSNGTLTNRVVIDKPITVQSLNGAETTAICGAKDLSGTYGIFGDAAVRCVYLGSNATLSGFTITNGATAGTRPSNEMEPDKNGAGVYSEPSGTILDCILVDNSAADAGGGAYGGILRSCVLTGNSSSMGGGAFNSVLESCTLRGNASDLGGGAYGGALSLCVLVGNSATDSGGGTAHNILHDCLLMQNSANLHGGGAHYANLANCTVAGNLVTNDGGGVYRSTLSNCIVYANSGNAYSNYRDSTLTYSCTAPPTGGTGNIALDPRFVNPADRNYQLDSNSPCIDRGNNLYVQGAMDLAGNSRIVFGRVDMGAYEVQSGAQEIHVSPDGGNVYPYDSLANAATNINAAVASAPSGAVVLVHSGTYVLTNSLVITNAVSLVGVDGADETIIDGNNSVACVISRHPDTLIEGLTVQRGRGTYYTSSYGGGICLESGGVVRACTVKNNWASQTGGGVAIGVSYDYGLIDSCVIISNQSAHYGGGVTLGNGELRNSVVAYNHADYGGGLHSDGNTPQILNSTIVSNLAASAGGGVYVRGGLFQNSIIYFNTALTCDNWFDYRGGVGLMSNTCTFPMPPGGGNMPDPPRFADPGIGDFRLRADSLCIDAGAHETWMETATDLDGNSRIVGPSPDMGAFEYQSTNLYVSMLAGPRRGTAPMQVAFSATPHDANPDSLYFAWDFDDDGIADDSGWGLAAVTTVYAHVGTYAVGLVASNASTMFGIVFSNMVSVSPADIYVSKFGLSVSPFTNLESAATNIQAALDVAMDGANVWLDDGTYQVDDTIFHHRPVAMKSIHGKESTILDGLGQRTIIELWNPAARVEGVRIVNGSGTAGGGIAAFGGGCIADASVVSNIARTGGGIYGLGAVCITNCEIAYNVATPGTGGGLEIAGGEVVLSRVFQNRSGNFGGGLCLRGGTVFSTSFIHNQGSAGGAIFVSGMGMIDRCVVISNTAVSGVFLSGGGISWSYGSGHLANSLVAWNEGESGGGLSMNLSQPSIINCTITHNTSPNGAGVYHRNASPSYTNTIISHNMGDEVVTVYDYSLIPMPQYDHTDGGLDVIYQDVPRGDFRLRWDSPGINAGTNLPEQIDGLDLDGKPRILDGIVDRGAYEQYPPDQDTDGDALPDGWEWQYFGGITNASPDELGADGMFSNMDHCIAGTDPHDPASFPQFEDIVVGETDDAGKVVLHWTSYPGRVYSLYRCNDLTVGLFETIATTLPANSPENTYIDEDATGVGPWVYRLGIRSAE